MIFNYGAHKQRIISYAFLIVTKNFRFLLQFTGEEQRVKCSFSDHLHRGGAKMGQEVYEKYDE